MMRILIVEGSREERLHLVQTLGALADVAIVGAVPDVRDAIRAAVENPPDVIVTGVVLGDGDGTYLIERLRELAPAPAIIVVARAGGSEQRERYLAAGADRYVQDPGDGSELHPTLASLGKNRVATGTIPPAERLRLLGRLASGVAHDINNYLGVLQVTMTLARQSPHDREVWAQADGALDAMVRLNATLLGYARGATPVPEAVDVASVVRHTLGVLGRVVPPNITLDLLIEEGLRPVLGVRAELEQLVLNLVINACDAMAGDSGGRLGITLRRSTNAAVLLEITDTGEGMPSEVVEQCGASTRRDGLGLGLGIVRRVVEHHRGALRVNPRVERGTLVAVMLPTVAVNGGARAGGGTASEPPRSAKGVA